jgi:anti-sigma regulatory factor (Ser/Thr protein kinase)
VKILEQIHVNDKASLICAKTVLKNFLRDYKEFQDHTFLIFTLMELSTNLIKHANGGEIWLMEKDSQLLMAALDNGHGMTNIDWAMQKGTTRMQNSLGLGLYQIANHDYYTAEIVSFVKKELHGTIVLVYPKKLCMDIITLQTLYMDESVSGDLVAKKGKFLLLADGSGHGKKANKSVQLLRSYFYDNMFSCVLIDEFFQKVHDTLKNLGLRGIVLSVFEVSKKQVQVCGIGNIALWEKRGNRYVHTQQKSGILGEAFRKSESRVFEFQEGCRIIAATDGIDVGKMDNLLSLLSQTYSPAMIALCAVFFASVKYDDKSILIISKNHRGETIDE